MDRQWSVRDQHREDVLALLDRGQNLTRGEIARTLRLTRSTVSEVLGQLLDQGIIAVTEQRAPGGRGRLLKSSDSTPVRCATSVSTSRMSPSASAWRTPPVT